MSDSNLVSNFLPASKGEYTIGRMGGKIDKICIHHAATNRLSTLDIVITNSARQVSVHYGIQDTTIHQYVKEKDAAWHATNWACNKSSIGIEVVNSTLRVNGKDNDPNSWKVSDTTLTYLIKLVADIAKRNNLGKLVPGKNLVWHSMYYATFCPGNYLRSKMNFIAEKVNEINFPVIATPKYDLYKVKNGDTLSKIAVKYKSTWEKIYADNKAVIDQIAKEAGVKKDFFNYLSGGTELKIYK